MVWLLEQDAGSIGRHHRWRECGMARESKLGGRAKPAEDLRRQLQRELEEERAKKVAGREADVARIEATAALVFPEDVARDLAVWLRKHLEGIPLKSSAAPGTTSIDPFHVHRELQFPPQMGARKRTTDFVLVRRKIFVETMLRERAEGVRIVAHLLWRVFGDRTADAAVLFLSKRLRKVSVDDERIPADMLRDDVMGKDA
jgi:hypothetical protein